MRPYTWRIQPSESKSWMMGCQASKIRCTEAEYMVMAEVGTETIWMTDYLEELNMKQHEKILYRDSQSVIQLVRNSVYHLKKKHRMWYHFTRRLVEDGDVFREDKGCKESNKHVDKMCWCWNIEVVQNLNWYGAVKMFMVVWEWNSWLTGSVWELLGYGACCLFILSHI